MAVVYETPNCKPGKSTGGSRERTADLGGSMRHGGQPGVDRVGDMAISIKLTVNGTPQVLHADGSASSVPEVGGARSSSRLRRRRERSRRDRVARLSLSTLTRSPVMSRSTARAR